MFLNFMFSEIYTLSSANICSSFDKIVSNFRVQSQVSLLCDYMLNQLRFPERNTMKNILQPARIRGWI
jgi:hypothetical protein